MVLDTGDRDFIEELITDVGTTPASSAYTSVATYSSLPSASSSNNGEVYLVLTTTGAYGFGQKVAGWYVSTGSAWNYLGTYNPANIVVGGTVSIEDSDGNSLSSTKGSLNVNITGGGGSSEVSVTNFPSVQSISGTVAISNPISSISINNFPVSQAVTGTFYQATQPVSIASMPSTPVTGSFYQATQPVSIASMPSTPVTGTFWQTTQPVSIASMPSTPVTGTFWQATQPISGNVSVSNFPSSQAVTGTFYQQTQPVSIASAVSTIESTNFSSTATQSTVSCTASSSTLLLAANANRKGVFINTTGAKPINITYGAAGTNSATIFTVLCPAISDSSGGQVWTMPFPIYQGALYGFTASTETVVVTEMT